MGVCATLITISNSTYVEDRLSCRCEKYFLHFTLLLIDGVDFAISVKTCCNTLLYKILKINRGNRLDNSIYITKPSILEKTV